MMHHAPYMEWAKARPESPIDLGQSNVLNCTLEDLPGARDALDFAGRNDEGYPPLLEAIARRYQAAPEQVATAIGTSGANFLACLALLTPGEEVVIETPAYDPLLAVARTLGARVKRFERRVDDRFAVDPAAVKNALTPSTRLIVITQPHNPSGGLTSSEAIVEIAKLADRQGAMVLVDEVYLDAATGCGSRPAARLADNIISTNSLTKSYGLAPLRCGWAIAAPSVARRIRRARDLVDGTGPIPAERLSVLAFEHLDRLASRAQSMLDPNVRALREFLSRTPALDGFVEHGTVAFPRVRDLADATPLVAELFKRWGTAVVPGKFFEAPAHFRIGLGVAPETLTAGLRNLRALLNPER